ncbi:hypothetical protein, partial [Spirilliplanes yamanashiensis]|uniref:hypothetical protein n=1 Tax=Spirilliplanes yamanashiensis TaxID=42233 RepID=UPI0031D98E58
MATPRSIDDGRARPSMTVGNRMATQGSRLDTKASRAHAELGSRQPGDTAGKRDPRGPRILLSKTTRRLALLALVPAMLLGSLMIA